MLPKQNQTTLAALFATAAFGIWGLSPVYFKQVAHVPATEVLAHRIIWSFILLTLTTAMTHQTGIVRDLVKNRTALKTLTLSACVVGISWLTFIWAIANNRIVDASLGYYLNPIISVLLALIFLKERLTRLQTAALFLAAAGVAWQVFTLGKLPAISLLLALSFGFYGLIRKQAAVPTLPGLLLETVIMLPFALAWVIWQAQQGATSFSAQDIGTSAWLMMAGIITSVPLLMFTHAAPKLRLTTLGFLQYLAPSLALGLGVLVYQEPFGFNLKISFAFIWLGLLVFSADAVLRQKYHSKS